MPFYKNENTHMHKVPLSPVLNSGISYNEKKTPINFCIVWLILYDFENEN